MVPSFISSSFVASYFPYLFGNADATRLASNAQEVTTGLVKVSVSQSTTTLLAGEEIADTLKEWSPAFGKLFVAATINYVVEPFVPFHIKEAEIIPVPLQHGSSFAQLFLSRCVPLNLC